MKNDVRLIRGDCLEILPTLESGSIDAIVTDPPYNVVNRDDSGLRSFDKGEADSAPIDIPTLAREFVRIVSGSIYVWCSSEQVSEWRKEFVRLGLTTRQCVWVKTNPSPANGEHFWLSAVELCVFARKPKAPFFRHCKSPVWTGPSDQKITWHPSPKPMWLMRELIMASVPENGLVLDPFAGSAPTLLACLKSGRRGIGIEMNEKYVTLGRRRLKGSETPMFDAGPVIVPILPRPSAQVSMFAFGDGSDM